MLMSMSIHMTHHQHHRHRRRHQISSAPITIRSLRCHCECSK